MSLVNYGCRMVNSNFSHQEIESSGKRIHSYTSAATGLTCVNVDLDLPTVSGYFTLATECFNDSGSPHTLEHLIFLGSERWPYKGVLDSLANRAFAQGTNAWTDTDHTAYTIETVGQEGFLKLLPIFVDHILYPTLTESGCYTEVHHINGKGEDAGVVYSEMQGVENTGPSLINLRVQRQIHHAQSGYRSETGGLLGEVRTLSVKEIRDYHAKYYVPHNLVLVVTGRLDQADLLGVLEDVDGNILDHGLPDRSTWKRPWVDSDPQFDLSSSSKEILEFPEEDETMGDVSINWAGPSCTSYIDVCALDILGQYLTHSAISPMQTELVEIEEPFCTDVEFYVSDRLRSVISVNLSSVPVEILNEAEEKFFEVLSTVREGDLDMERMKALIVKDKLKVKNAVESDPHSAFSTPIITDFLYGDRGSGSSLQEALDDEKYLDLVNKWTSREWLSFIDKWLLQKPHITILGKPSAVLAQKIQEDESARTARQAAALGERGLADMEQKLKTAQELNDRDIPRNMIQDFKVPSVEGINFIIPETARAGLSLPLFPRLNNNIQRLVDSDDCDLPLFIQFDDTSPSEFANISLFLTSTSVDRELLPYLSVYLHSFFLNPIMKDGIEIDYEDVVEKLELDTISYSASFGAGGGFDELIRIKIKVEASKYGLGIAWISDLLYQSVFDADRIGVAISKILNDLPSAKRDGDTVASAVLGALQIDLQKSAGRAANLLEQTHFVEMLEKRLDEDEESELAQFEKLRGQLAKFENMRVHVSTDVAKLSRPVSSWSNFGPAKITKRPRANSTVLHEVPLARDVLTPYGEHPSGQCKVITISTDSCYAKHFAKGLDDFNHPDLAPLLVISTYLNAMEGLLWKYIRGSGLAYGADLKVDLEGGLVYFSIYRSPEAFAAWDKAREIMLRLRDGDLEISELMLDGAKSSLVYDFVSRESTPGGAAQQSFINQILKKQTSDYRRNLLKDIAKVTIDEMKAMLAKYLVGIFETEKTNAVIVCGTNKAAQQIESFKSAGFAVTSSSLEEFEKEYIK